MYVTKYLQITLLRSVSIPFIPLPFFTSPFFFYSLPSFPFLFSPFFPFPLLIALRCLFLCLPVSWCVPILPSLYLCLGLPCRARVPRVSLLSRSSLSLFSRTLIFHCLFVSFHMLLCKGRIINSKR